MTTPSSQTFGPGWNASDGNVLASVTPAFLFGYWSKTGLTALRMVLMSVTALVSLNSFGMCGIAGLHAPSR